MPATGMSLVERTKAGTSKGAAAERRKAFVQAYLTNNHNATRAAITAGYSPKTAYSAGERLLRDVEVSRELAEAARAVSDKVELSTAETLLELKHIATSDLRRYYRADGRIADPTEWDEAMAAAVSSIEMDHVVVRTGKRTRIVPVVSKIKFWSKTEALNIAFKHQGLFERDNRQRADNLALQINLVGAPVHEGPREIEVTANLVKPNGNGSSGGPRA